MKIVQVTPRYPPHTGGVETHVKEISERLVGRSHEVIVVTADAGPDVRNRERRNGVKVQRHRGLSLDGAFHVAPSIALSVRKADADVVHAHNYHSLPLLFAAMGVTDERFVVTPHYHGGSASSVRDRLLSLYGPFGGWALQRADDVLAVSEWELYQLESDFDVSAKIVPNGLLVERFEDANPERHDQPYLLTVGRLEEYKGHQHAIRGLPRLDGYDLLIAGSGPYREELERVARVEGVPGRVDFLGYVDDERLMSLYAGAEVFLNLSRFEAYGMTVAEALAAGTPCVIREETALTEWMDSDACIGVRSTTPETIADAVMSVRSRTPDPGSIPHWDDIVTRLLDVYCRQS